MRYHLDSCLVQNIPRMTCPQGPTSSRHFTGMHPVPHPDEAAVNSHGRSRGTSYSSLSPSLAALRDANQLPQRCREGLRGSFSTQSPIAER